MAISANEFLKRHAEGTLRKKGNKCQDCGKLCAGLLCIECFDWEKLGETVEQHPFSIYRTFGSVSE